MTKFYVNLQPTATLLISEPGTGYEQIIQHQAQTHVQLKVARNALIVCKGGGGAVEIK